MKVCVPLGCQKFGVVNFMTGGLFGYSFGNLSVAGNKPPSLRYNGMFMVGSGENTKLTMECSVFLQSLLAIHKRQSHQRGPLKIHLLGSWLTLTKHI